MTQGNATDEKAYNDAVLKAGAAVESLLKSDGWEIFMALFHRKRKEIEARSDYESLDEFKGDRNAIEIVKGIIKQMEEYQEDAEALLKMMSENQPEKPSRGILFIEALEEGGREG